MHIGTHKDAQQNIDKSNLFHEIPWNSTETRDGDGQSNVSISVTNPVVTLSRQDLDLFPNFVTEEESKDILREVYASNNHRFTWEGFESRRRVLLFSLATDHNGIVQNDTLPKTLKLLVDRARKFCDKSGQNPIKQVTIEEYTYSQLSLHLNQSKLQATVFETAGTCSECCCSTATATTKSPGITCGCYVACLPLTVSLIQNINRPKQRQPNCWELHPPPANHQTMMILNKFTLLVKRRDFLFEWRHRIVKTVTAVDHNNLPTEQRVVLIKLYGVSKQSIESTIPCNPDFGFVPTLQDKEEELRRRSEKIPKLEDLLTIIVTTSPVKSNPSTELLQKVFDTFQFCGDDFAYKCRKVIVCDGCRQRNESTTKKHANNKQSMRNGIVTTDQFKNYAVFKQNLNRLCKEHDDTTTSTKESLFSFRHTSVVELEIRQGYGFVLRHALREHVRTPYVIVIQHDRTFMRPTPIKETIKAMWHNSRIKYVGMSMRSNLLYRDIFIGQYGRSYSDEMLDCVIRPPELALSANKYGTDSESTEKMDCGVKEKLRENILVLAEKYKWSQQCIDHVEWLNASEVPKDKCQLSLTPTFFWYDNVHICETQHYRDFIFDPQYKMVVRGGFVEDKLSPVIKRTVERLGLREGHSRFGCFLLDDHSGMFFTGHLDGGTYMTQTQKKELIDNVKNRDGSATTTS